MRAPAIAKPAGRCGQAAKSACTGSSRPPQIDQDGKLRLRIVEQFVQDSADGAAPVGAARRPAAHDMRVVLLAQPDRPRLAKSYHARHRRGRSHPPHAGQADVLLQPLRQPGAAPEVMPTSRVCGVCSCWTPRFHRTVQRFDSPASGNSWPAGFGDSRQAPQELLQDDAGGAKVGGSCRAVRQRLGGAVTLVHLEHRQPRAAAQLGGRIATPAPYCRGWRAPGIERNPHQPTHQVTHSRTRTSALEPVVHRRPPGWSLAAWRCAAGDCPLRRRCVSARNQMQGRIGDGRGRQAWPQGYACPAVGDNIQASRPGGADGALV